MHQNISILHQYVNGSIVKGLVLITKTTTSPVQPSPGPTQQELLGRIQSLELQLRAQSTVPAAVPVPVPIPVTPPPMPGGGFHRGR